jgi:ABC-type glycerol-3-phosphate transport system permease component
MASAAEHPLPVAAARSRVTFDRKRVPIYAGYLVLAAIVLFPVSWALLGSFKNASEIFQYPPRLWPRDFTFANYVDVLQRTGFANYLYNTAVVAGLTVICTLAFGAVAAYGFSRWDFKLKYPILVFLLALQLIPSTVNIIPYYMMMNSLGLLNTLTGLVIIYTATHIPFTIWVLKGFYDTIPRSLDEAGQIDGASRFRILWSVILPISVPGLAAAGFLVFLASWGEFLVPLVLANSRDTAVITVGLYSFFGVDVTAYHTLFAASTLATAPVIVVYLFAQEYFISGLTAGSEK